MVKTSRENFQKISRNFTEIRSDAWRWRRSLKYCSSINRLIDWFDSIKKSLLSINDCPIKQSSTKWRWWQQCQVRKLEKLFDFCLDSMIDMKTDIEKWICSTHIIIIPFLCYVLIFFEERKKRKTSLYWIIHCSFLCVWCVWKWLNVILFIFIFNTCWSLVWFAHTRVFSLYEKPFFSTKFTIFLVNFLTNIFIMIMVSHIIIRSVLMNILYFVKVFFVFSEKTLCGFSLLTW